MVHTFAKAFISLTFHCNALESSPLGVFVASICSSRPFLASFIRALNSHTKSDLEDSSRGPSLTALQQLLKNETKPSIPRNNDNHVSTMLSRPQELHRQHIALYRSFMMDLSVSWVKYRAANGSTGSGSGSESWIHLLNGAGSGSESWIHLLNGAGSESWIHLLNGAGSESWFHLLNGSESEKKIHIQCEVPWSKKSQASIKKILRTQSEYICAHAIWDDLGRR
ncbi:unnamed protein product [Albugo candida]|uniref:Uncharacterized protein n=1 Tax=Albugo candida TaxID=65357 RepID=A0A024FTM7_9STRA|nr:unnamed protein product [Albugo candida]|eukprot:CCI10396.1 unnamed protein product [Albugo candida]